MRFAGIYEPTGEGISIGAATTTEPVCGVVKDVHHRMQLLLDETCRMNWINDEFQERDAIRAATRYLGPKMIIA